MAGTRTHGKRLYRPSGWHRKATLTRWEDGLTGSRKITIRSASRPEHARTDTAILVVVRRCRNGYVVYGRDYDVSLREEEHRPNAAPKSSAPRGRAEEPDQRKDVDGSQSVRSDRAGFRRGAASPAG
jgi:hypothetical protein